jgi:plastocyanin
MKRVALMLTAVGATVAFAAVLGGPGSAATSAPKQAKITIRHQLRGCHTWSVNGGAYRAAQHVKLARGGTITFVNNDMMPHRLVLKSGPAVKFIGRANMNHMAASAKVRFAHAGTYRFMTKAGEDYKNMGDAKTIGEDNVLTLKVVVS